MLHMLHTCYTHFTHMLHTRCTHVPPCCVTTFHWKRYAQVFGARPEQMTTSPSNTRRDGGTSEGRNDGPSARRSDGPSARRIDGPPPLFSDSEDDLLDIWSHDVESLRNDVMC